MGYAMRVVMEVAGEEYGSAVEAEAGAVDAAPEAIEEAEGVEALDESEGPEPREVSSDATEGADAAEAPEPPEPEHLDLDEIEALGDEIAMLAAESDAAKGEILERIRRFDRAGGWELAGHRTCAHWLAFRTGMNLATAREHVRVARALEELPHTSETMSRGALSFSKVRALTRVARPETEGDLLELAGGATAGQLEVMVRAWRKNSRIEEAELERERHRSRRLVVYPENGMYAVRALLTADDGASLMRAIDELCDELYHAERASGLAPEDDTEAAAARRRADALGLLVERAMMVGADTGEDGKPVVSGTRAQRYQVMLHVEPETLTRDGGPARSELEDGTRVSAETARQIACDAGIVRVTHGPDGSVLDVGRRSRSITTALRRALEVRDRGCRFPGCGLRFTQGHHIEHWGDGGETALSNSILLCKLHHALLHTGGWRLELWSHGRVAFIDPRGTTHVGGERPRPPRLPEQPGAEALVSRNRARGVEPDAYTACARWKRERDIPDAVLFRAIEAGMG